MIDVQYKKRTWLVVNTDTSDVIDAFTGTHGKRDANRRALQIRSPHLFGLADDIANGSPWLASRAFAGAQMAADGFVFAASDLGAMVDSSRDRGSYSVHEHDGMMWCECSDYMNGNAPMDRTMQAWCKHLFAWQFELSRIRLATEIE